MELNYMDLHIKELIALIGKNIISRIYSSETYSKVTLSLSKEIVSESIGVYASINDMSTSILKNKLIYTLNSNYHDFVLDLMIFITNFDSNLTPIFKDLERDRNLFFRIDSLYSDKLEYNEILHKRISKARIFNIPYIITPSQGIYIADKNIITLDLTKIENIKTLDINRLIQCPFLRKIILNPYLEDILNLKNLSYNKGDYPVTIDITSASLSLAAKIVSHEHKCRSSFYKKHYDIECHNDALWNCVSEDFIYDDYDQCDEYLDNL